MRQCCLVFGLSLFLQLCALQSLEAGIILADGPQQGNRDEWLGPVGTRFAIGRADIIVTALGFEDPRGHALQVSHQVGLWNDVGTLLASVTVPAGTLGVFNDGWRYASIAPTRLTAGATYRIAAQVVPGVDAWTDADDFGGNGVPDFSLSSLIVHTHPTNVFQSGIFQFPSLDGHGQDLRWAPANAIATVVPEPSSVVLFALGGVALAAYNRATGSAENKGIRRGAPGCPSTRASGPHHCVAG